MLLTQIKQTLTNQMSLGTGGSPGVDMVDATHEVGGGVGVGWGGDDNVLCTCTHGWCYATSCFLHLHTWFVLRNIIFLALARMVGATQHHFPCTCTHGRCYATSCFLHLHTWLHLMVPDKIEHRYLLSSHFLNKAPGLARIMQALRCHKMKCKSGLVSPTDAFKKPLWQLWLTCSKKKRLTVRLIGPRIHCK